MNFLIIVWSIIEKAYFNLDVKAGKNMELIWGQGII